MGGSEYWMSLFLGRNGTVGLGWVPGVRLVGWEGEREREKERRREGEKGGERGIEGGSELGFVGLVYVCVRVRVVASLGWHGTT